ncbi:hypothetical protein B7494_g4484 [Chlorociboria aeruginascens]|nr:hypothetical protein B7494_g4484 [Chlorociboria aeruginascens]
MHGRDPGSAKALSSDGQTNCKSDLFLLKPSMPPSSSWTEPLHAVSTNETTTPCHVAPTHGYGSSFDRTISTSMVEPQRKLGREEVGEDDEERGRREEAGGRRQKGGEG